MTLVPCEFISVARSFENSSVDGFGFVVYSCVEFTAVSWFHYIKENHIMV